MLCVYGSAEALKSLWDKSGTSISSPNSKYQKKGAVPARVDFRVWNGIWRDEPCESLQNALMQLNGNVGSSRTTPSISSDCAAFPDHQDASQAVCFTGRLCWCYICSCLHSHVYCPELVHIYRWPVHRSGFAHTQTSQWLNDCSYLNTYNNSLYFTHSSILRG